MEGNRFVKYLYGTALGRRVLKIILRFHLDKIAVFYLCSPMSKTIIPWYIKKNEIDMAQYQE